MNNTNGPPPGPPMGPPLMFRPGEREDRNRSAEIIGVSCTLGALAFIVVLLRIWVRIKFISKIAVEDWLMTLSAVMLLFMAGISVPMTQKGVGRHIEYIPPPDLPAALHLNFVTQPMSLIALGMAKLSVGAFLLRVSPSKFYTWFIWALLGVTVLSTTAGTFQLLFQCRPMEFIWNKALPGGGQCIPGDTVVIAASFGFAIGIGTDFIFALLPVPMLWKVQLNWRVKLALMGILSLGLFTCAAAIVKTMFITNLGKEGDFTWDSVDITIWYNAEIAVAIIAGSIPSLKPLFKKILESTSARRYAYGSKYGTNSRSRGGGRNTVASKAASSAARQSKMPARVSKMMDAFTLHNRDDIESQVANDKPGNVYEMKTSPVTEKKPQSQAHAVHYPPAAVLADKNSASGGGLRRNPSLALAAPTINTGSSSTLGIGVAIGGHDGASSCRSSGDSSGIIIQRPEDEYRIPPGRISRTTEISVAVEDTYQRSVRHMV